MIPIKPFDSYKWRWLSVQPSESLLRPPIFLGVLRALERCEGLAPSDQQVFDALLKVEVETNSPVTLARDLDRNLLRNSGQYWRGTGLLEPTTGRIELTALGHQVAGGRVTQGEFSAIMVQQTTLPNSKTYSAAEVEKWKEADLEIKPLALILSILEKLGEISGVQQSYVTRGELITAVIPLAGAKNSAENIATALLQIRNGTLNTNGWPDCAPEANDRRLAGEFLTFLSNYGICRFVQGTTNEDHRYYLDELFDVDAVIVSTRDSIFAGTTQAEAVLEAVRNSALPSIIERQRTVTTILSRPGQPKFRKGVLKASEGRCLITGETISEVLEAAHIIPVNSGGSDECDNGICLRVDIHRLFDSGNIRLKPDGELQFSDALKDSDSYQILPRRIFIPAFVRPANIEWRDKYW